jgi:CDP-glucose 4,6-dehydratase
LENLNTLKKFWKDKKVFITGHTGFKGAWLCIFMNLLGAKVYGYSLSPKKKSLFNQANCKKFLKKNIYANIQNYNFLRNQILKIRPEIIFHLAAQPLVSKSFENPLETFNTNIIGTTNILNLVRNQKSIKSVVIITTDKVYEIKKNNKSYNEEDALGGKDPYSSSKVCAEIIMNSYNETFYKNNFLRNKISTARSGNVIGGGDYSENRLVPDIIEAINKKKKLVIRNPSNIRPWQHVIEPLLGYMKLAELQYKNKKINIKKPAWNFGPNKNSFVKVIDVVNYIENKVKLKKKVQKKQSFFETKILKLNSNKAKKYLKWYPVWNLKKSIDSVIEWNSLYKKTNNAKQICENQIIKYLK